MNTLDSWKNAKSAFHRQLALNQEQLNNYPAHWDHFVDLVRASKVTSILDIGCGCGTYCKICEVNFPEVEYYGIDYAEEAISVAKNEWGDDMFAVMDYKSLTKGYVQRFDALHMGALLDVLPDADAALDFILSLDVKHVIISRMRMVNGESRTESYVAYDEIRTTTYYHSQKVFSEICNKHSYQVAQHGECYLLTKYGEI